MLKNRNFFAEYLRRL